MLPIFYSQYSGKGLFVYDPPDKAAKNHKQSIAALCLKHDIKQPIVVDSKMTGVMELYQNFPPLGLNPIFGWQCRFIHDLNAENSDWHKVIVFIRNNQGYRDLIKLHNRTNIDNGGFVTPEDLKKYWTENLKLAIPFYDSYLFKNILYGTACSHEFGDIPHVFFYEKNGLPFDTLVASQITGDKILVKSVYYENEDDFKTWLVYRCCLNYSNKGKIRNLESPMFDHCHSHEFSFESYLKYNQQEKT